MDKVNDYNRTTSRNYLPVDSIAFTVTQLSIRKKRDSWEASSAIVWSPYTRAVESEWPQESRLTHEGDTGGGR